jgi:hypothetical protein
MLLVRSHTDWGKAPSRDRTTKNGAPKGSAVPHASAPTPGLWIMPVLDARRSTGCRYFITEHDATGPEKVHRLLGLRALDTHVRSDNIEER